MSKFFVGQRVRIVGAGSFPQVIGSECRITALDQKSLRISDGGIDKGMVQVDIPPPGYPWMRLCVKPAWLEPILPEGSAPSEFTFQQLMDNLQEVMA